MSSFTGSDSSSTTDDSSDAQVLPSIEIAISSSAATLPPPPPPLNKPPVANRRSSLPPRVGRSAGSSVATPKPPALRSRNDTGDYSKTSATTNTSRHRRLEQFQFSPLSMERIWHGADGKGVPPPMFVLCQEPNQPTGPEADESGYISPLEENDEGDILWMDGDEREDDPASSPFAILDRNIAEEESTAKKPPRRPPSQRISNPVYLRKHPSLEQISGGRVILSGWIAVSIGDDSLVTKLLLKRSNKLELEDLYYMRIVEENQRTAIVLHNTKGMVVHSLHPEWDWICESREISCRIGRCVVLRNKSREIAATLLPVSLSDCFFPTGELVTSKKFSRLHKHLFAEGNGKVYAPDAQHDAAMFIIFSLDSLIKGCSR
jgi:hypothetical protein